MDFPTTLHVYAISLQNQQPLQFTYKNTFTSSFFKKNKKVDDS